MDDIRNYVDRTDTNTHQTSERIEELLQTSMQDLTFIELANAGFKGRKFTNTEYANCIPANTRMWCVPMHRYANCKELMALQGFETLNK